MTRLRALLARRRTVRIIELAVRRHGLINTSWARTRRSKVRAADPKDYFQQEWPTFIDDPPPDNFEPEIISRTFYGRLRWRAKMLRFRSLLLLLSQRNLDYTAVWSDAVQDSIPFPLPHWLYPYRLSHTCSRWPDSRSGFANRLREEYLPAWNDLFERTFDPKRFIRQGALLQSAKGHAGKPWGRRLDGRRR